MGFIGAFWRQFRIVIVFLLLEGIALYLLFSFNSYQSSYAFSLTSTIRDNVFATFSLVEDYLNLPEKNWELANTNTALLEKLKANEQQFVGTPIANGRYTTTPAKIIHSSTKNPDNYIVVNKGTKDGIAPEMAVLSAKGLVGIVYAATENYASIMPIINTSFSCLVSVGEYTLSANTSWNGENYRYVNVTEMPLHLQINRGDSVFTNNNSALYPSGELIGVVEAITKEDLGKSNALKVRLATDFAKLHYVYILRDKDKPQIDSLLNNE